MIITQIIKIKKLIIIPFKKKNQKFNRKSIKTALILREKKILIIKM